MLAGRSVIVDDCGIGVGDGGDDGGNGGDGGDDVNGFHCPGC